MKPKTKELTPEQALKKAQARLPQAFTEAAVDFEKSKSENLKKLVKILTGGIIAASAFGVLGSAAALVAIFKRTEPEPVVLQVDNATGATTMLRSIRDTQDKYAEVINKYWLAQYVRTCESYDWYTIGENFEICKLMSESDVATEYSKKVQSPTAPLKLLKDKGKVVAKIDSITFVGDIAHVRFSTEKLNSSGENMDNSPVQRWLATIAYRFKPGQMTEQQRLANPLGFKVFSYRADPEVLK
jgi:type IV secretion system protein VirB8